MTSVAVRPGWLPVGRGHYPGWWQVAFAAAAMVATLPGRTQGLGLVTEPLLRDLALSPVAYAQLNLWATLLGAGFCLASGRLLDRHGARAVLTGLLAALGLTVCVMSQAASVPALTACLVLTRGLGQSALSAASIALVGQWFGRRLAPAMALFSVLLSVGFMTAFPTVEWLVRDAGWRSAWLLVGLAVLALAPLAAALVRRSAAAAGLADEEFSLPDHGGGGDAEGWTPGAALRTPAFWIVGLCSAVYLLVASGIGLFNERILAELGFGREVYGRALAVTAVTALAGNFLAGRLGERHSPRVLLAAAMALLAAGLLALPHLRTPGQVYGQAVMMGVAGGFVTVLFFAFWSRHYGRRCLGQIQGAAQMLTVVGSALGPLVLAAGHAAEGSHAGVFRGLAAGVAGLALLAAVMPLPGRR
jgi:MFS family permease